MKVIPHIKTPMMITPEYHPIGITVGTGNYLLVAYMKNGFRIMNKPYQFEISRLYSQPLVLIVLLFTLTGIPLTTGADQDPGDEQLHQQALIMYDGYKKKFSQVKDINADAAIDLLSDPDVVFVDVRRRKEQTVSMIPGAITASQFKDDLERYRGKQIITYCTISYRSGKLASKLEREGLSVMNLRAGLLGWVHAGGPLADEKGPTERLHVYGRKWDLAPKKIETVY